MAARPGSFAKAFDRNGQIGRFVARALTNRGTLGLYTELSPVARAWADGASHQILPATPPDLCTFVSIDSRRWAEYNRNIRAASPCEGFNRQKDKERKSLPLTSIAGTSIALSDL